MEIILDLQYEVEGAFPSADLIQSWLDCALSKGKQGGELCVRIVSPTESQQLNNDYRGKDKPTNVLSFPFEVPEGIPVEILGDLVICADVVTEEATAQRKKLFDHWAHMIIHGYLHLIGYDHINDTEADEMENLERAILAQLQIEDPYREIN